MILTSSQRSFFTLPSSVVDNANFFCSSKHSLSLPLLPFFYAPIFYRGVLNKALYGGGSALGPTPYPLNHSGTKESTPFIYLLYLQMVYLFHICSLELCIPFEF